ATLTFFAMRLVPRNVVRSQRTEGGESQQGRPCYFGFQPARSHTILKCFSETGCTESLLPRARRIIPSSLGSFFNDSRVTMALNFALKPTSTDIQIGFSLVAFGS